MRGNHFANKMRRWGSCQKEQERKKEKKCVKWGERKRDHVRRENEGGFGSCPNYYCSVKEKLAVKIARPIERMPQRGV